MKEHFTRCKLWLIAVFLIFCGQQLSFMAQMNQTLATQTKLDVSDHYSFFVDSKKIYPLKKHQLTPPPAIHKMLRAFL